MKPVKMWAVYRDGKMLVSSVSAERAGSIHKIVGPMMWNKSGAEWEQYEAIGYRCIPVTVTPDPQSVQEGGE